MNQARVGLLVAAALMMVPLTAAAQPKKADDKPADTKAAGDKAAGDKAAGDKAAGDKAAGDTAAGEGEPGGEGATPGEGEGEGEGEKPEGEGEGTPTGGGLEELCAIDPDACKAIDLPKAAARDLDVEIYAVQQIYALRRLRFELNP